MCEDNQKSALMNSLDSINENDLYFRSEIHNMARKIAVDPNNYEQWVKREHPDIVILDDLSIDESIF